MALPSYGRNVYGPVALGDLSLIVIQATIASGAATLDAANSSPGCTIAKNGTGTYDITYPPGEGFLLLTAEVQLAESAGSKLYLEASNAPAGTATFESAVTPGTAADPANDSRLHIAFLVRGF